PTPLKLLCIPNTPPLNASTCWANVGSSLGGFIIHIAKPSPPKWGLLDTSKRISISHAVLSRGYSFHIHPRRSCVVGVNRSKYFVSTLLPPNDQYTCDLSMGGRNE